MYTISGFPRRVSAIPEKENVFHYTSEWLRRMLKMPICMKINLPFHFKHAALTLLPLAGRRFTAYVLLLTGKLTSAIDLKT